MTAMRGLDEVYVNCHGDLMLMVAASMFITLRAKHTDKLASERAAAAETYRQRMIDAENFIREMIDGAEPGRWLDETGTECPEGQGTYTRYDLDEQNGWIAALAAQGKGFLNANRRNQA